MNQSLTLYLHPGHSKAGSSAIQNFLFNNCKQLKKRDIAVVNQHMDISGELFQKRSQLPPVEWVRSTFQNYDENSTRIALERLQQKAVSRGIRALVLSVENLCNLLHREDGRRIHKIIRQVFEQVQVIYYVRRQDDYYLSSWQQWGHKLGMSLEEFVDHRLSINKPNYLQNCDVYRQIYGEENLTVIPFKSIFFHGEDLIADFLHHLGIPITDQFIREADENRGLNFALCRVLATLPHRYKGEHDQRVKKKLQDLVKSDVLFQKDRSFLSAQQRKRIMDHFREDNLRLCENYMKKCSFSDYFETVVVEDENEIDLLKKEVKELREVVTIQMDLLLELLD